MAWQGRVVLESDDDDDDDAAVSAPTFVDDSDTTQAALPSSLLGGYHSALAYVKDLQAQNETLLKACRDGGELSHVLAVRHQVAVKELRQRLYLLRLVVCQVCQFPWIGLGVEQHGR